MDIWILIEVFASAGANTAGCLSGNQGSSGLKMTTERLAAHSEIRTSRTFDKWLRLNCQTTAICLHIMKHTKTAQIQLIKIKCEMNNFAVSKTVVAIRWIMNY